MNNPRIVMKCQCMSKERGSFESEGQFASQLTESPVVQRAGLWLCVKPIAAKHGKVGFLNRNLNRYMPG